jgi:class 3 adenylate cyclase
MPTPPKEVQQLRALADHLREFGASKKAIDRALESGQLQEAIFDALALRSAAARTVTPAQLESRGGPPLEEQARFMNGSGFPLPAPSEPTFTPSEAAAMEELWQRRDVWPFDLAVRVSRVYGRLLARIAHAEVQMWVSVVEPSLREHPDPRTRALSGADSYEALMPLASEILVAVHQRWVEREMAQMAFRDQAFSTAVPGAIEVSLLFCDLKDFTAFADREGDDAAVELIDRFTDVVAREQGPEVRLTKLIGDGFMCAYPDPQPAVRAGARIIRAMQAPGRPVVHASVHHGLAIPHETDYFGATVNLAARLLGCAEGGELVCTRQVVDRCQDLNWERGGTLEIRGLSEPVEVFKLKRKRARPRR